MAANETRDRCPPTIREPEFPRGRDDIASRFASQRFRAPESYSVNVVIITIGRGPPISIDFIDFYILQFDITVRPAASEDMSRRGMHFPLAVPPPGGDSGGRIRLSDDRLKRFAIFQIRSLHFKLLFLRMSGMAVAGGSGRTGNR